MKRVAVIPFKGLKNCFICVSGQLKKKSLKGEKWYLGHRENTEEYSGWEDRVKPCITFAYVKNGVAAEWDGEYGPIQLWFKCEKDFKEGYDEAREHWIFPYAYGNSHWSQLAVDEERLPQKFNIGDYEGIFNVLKGWVEYNVNPQPKE